MSMGLDIKISVSRFMIEKGHTKEDAFKLINEILVALEWDDDESDKYTWATIEAEFEKANEKLK